MKDRNEYTPLFLAIRAVSHGTRQTIVDFLRKRGEATVNEITAYLGAEQAITSQHLKILREAKLVLVRRIGRFAVYRTNMHRLSRLEYMTVQFDQAEE